MGSTENKLKELMLKKSGSIEEFAAEIALSTKDLNGLLKRGIGNASISHVKTIADALGLKADSLSVAEIEIDRTTDDSPLNEQECQLIQSFRQLNDEGQEKVLDYTSDIISTGLYDYCER